MDSMQAIENVPGLESQIGQLPILEKQQAEAQQRAIAGRTRLAGIDEDISTTYKREGEASQDRQVELAGRERFMDQIDANAPQDNIKHVMQQSPLFMALVALAGGGFKSSAVTGLAAMNGMVQGMVKGDRQAYEDHWEEYKRQIESMKMRFEMRDQVYEEIKNNFALTREGQMHAWQIANASIGMDQADADRAYEQRKETTQIMQKAYMTYEQMKNARAIAAGHDVAIERSAELRAGAASGKAAALEVNRKEILGKIENKVADLMAQLEQHPAATGFAGKVRGVLEATNIMKGTVSADVESQAKELALLMAQYEKISRPSTYMMRSYEDIVGPNAQPLTTNKNALSRLKQLQDSLKGERSHPDAYKSADEVKAAYEAGDIDYDEAASALKEGGWASD